MSDARQPETLTTSQIEPKPLTFILPGIDDDLSIWEPLHEVCDSRIVTYLDWTELLDRNLDFLTEHVKTQIENAQPSGEIRLVGYSIGGSLSFAVTMALQAAGRRVSSMVLLDATGQTDPTPKPIGKQIRERLEQLGTLISRDGMGSLIAKGMTTQMTMPLLRRLSKSRHRKLPLDFDQYLHRKITIQLMRRMYWPWWRKTLDSGYSLTVPTILFRSADHPPSVSKDLGWSRFCKNLTVIPVAASHEAMMDPENIGAILAELQPFLSAQ